ncbi:MAG: exo-alpha-sialidase [Actinobacteria bacterium]|nr:MAG: exo-alpha-sialidase [Actinomycetota bacterium]
MKGKLWPLGVVAAALVLAVPGATAAAGDREVSVGSPSSPFSQNKQNEPALAMDAGNELVLAAGSNDNIDMEACNAGDPTTCPFTAGIGGSGIYFSFDGGKSWTQPTYTGLTARDCLGPAACTPHVGSIGTLPWYYENGLVSDGDPALAFGPRPGPNGFSWSNGSRLYYANLSSNLNAKKDETFKGVEAIYVSRTDDPQTAALGGAAGKDAWKQPVQVSQQSSATFADKEQIWADNAASSEFFGNVYVCWENFVASSGPLVVATSRDGGDSWDLKKVTAAHAAAGKHWGQSGCTVRTDSAGVVYVFYEEFQNPDKVGMPPTGTHFLVKSFDGGATWTKPMALYTVVDPCFAASFDGTSDRCVEDGVAGARNDLSASPSVSIANGAPTGAGATDEIVNAWADGRDGLNNEHVLFSYSNGGGDPGTWLTPTSIEAVKTGTSRDRGYYAAPALSPTGGDAWVVYNAYTTPFRTTTTTTRSLVGVVVHASIPTSGSSKGIVGSFSEVHRGTAGDPRTSSQNNLVIEFLGDYVYAVAGNSYAAAVWNDVRGGADCPAIDAWRAGVQTATTSDDVAKPAPQVDCPATFGNTDIFGWTSAP